MPRRQLYVLRTADRRDPHAVPVEGLDGALHDYRCGPTSRCSGRRFAPPLNGAALGSPTDGKHQVPDWHGHQQPGEGREGLMGRQIVRLASVVLLVAGMSSCTPGRERHAGPPAGTTTLDVRALDDDGDSKVLFSGRVVENVRGCEVDIACILRIEVDGLTTSVVYHFGEWPPCGNAAAIRQGIDVIEGEMVEVYAGIVDGDELTTCTSTEYYIRRVSGQ